MITITVSGKVKSGKTIVVNMIADALERCQIPYALRNSEDKWVTAPEARALLAGQQVEIIELAERQDRPTT